MPQGAREGGAPHVLVTANAAWNLLNFRKGLLAALIAGGHRVTILAPPDASIPALAAMGCRIIPLKMDNKGLAPHRDLALFGRFLAVLRVERPDIVLSYTIKNNVYGALAARALGIPFIPNVSGLGTGFLSQAWLRVLVACLYRAAFRSVHAVFFQNEDDRALFVRERLVQAEKTRCLPGSGVDLDHFAPAPPPPSEEGVAFLLVARMLRDKGVAEFVEAARIVRRRHPGAVFRLLGSMSAANRTAIDRATMEAWCAEGVVAYLGETDDVRPFVAFADCVVLPSYREGKPRSLLEAGAMARPVIATDVPGCRDVVEEGRTGFLCRVRDPADLARAMEAMIALDPVGRAQFGRRARQKVEREYDQALVIESYCREIKAATATALGRVTRPPSALSPGASAEPRQGSGSPA